MAVRGRSSTTAQQHRAEDLTRERGIIARYVFSYTVGKKAGQRITGQLDGAGERSAAALEPVATRDVGRRSVKDYDVRSISNETDSSAGPRLSIHNT